jgi:diphosphomevalonate decarboxylase
MNIIAAEAPSNIALIKYMGKLPLNPNIANLDRNRPTNASLSVTLPHLRTRVELEQISAVQDTWQPLQSPGWLVPELSEKGRQRFLSHFAKLKSTFKISGFYEVRSASNFPSDCGLASSASSFAALTMAAGQLAQKHNSHLDLTVEKLADLSRQGSGSSIRSFYGPLSIWDTDGAREVEIPGLNFIHEVVVVEEQKKQVSSSEAHERVITSPLFAGRPMRAEQRLSELVAELSNARTDRRAWANAFRITWDEFHDMHALFSTAKPPFSYFTEGTNKVLDFLQSYWERAGNGPLVTMDAGANVHLLYREDQINTQKEIRAHMLSLGFKVFA